jgi:flavin reductase (DIM6/NTAB) family NADH-FMN oxidoreductase RutF
MDPTAFRQVMARLATGITVVTTSAEGRLHGITVNSLASASLDPLLLLVCIDRQAKAHLEIERAGRFGVNFLSADQEAVSRTFATSGEPEKGRLRGVPFKMGPHGTPLLDGCLAHLECVLADRFPAGDHTIYLGSVVGGDLGEEALPLLYFDRGYRRLAE